MATRRIREFLVGNRIGYQSIHHTCAYTAQEVAETSHVPGRFMAKVVVVWLDGKLALVAVPATKVVDLLKLRREIGAVDVRLAHESDFRDQFSGCQVGTVPPFGNLFGLDTFLDEQLTLGEQFAFNAGTHKDVMIVRYMDYIRLVRPHIVDVAVEPCKLTAAKTPKAQSRREERGELQSQTADTYAVAEQELQAQCGCEIETYDGAD